jgi:hypothetical protein
MRGGGGRKSGGNFTLGEKDGEGGLHSLIIKKKHDAWQTTTAARR